MANKEEPRRPTAGHKTEATGQVMGDEAAELRRLRGELSEQETLLSGFQRENERLYEQQRAADKQGRATRDAMFHENQKLKADMSLLRYGRRPMNIISINFCHIVTRRGLCY